MVEFSHAIIFVSDMARDPDGLPFSVVEEPTDS